MKLWYKNPADYEQVLECVIANGGSENDIKIDDLTNKNYIDFKDSFEFADGVIASIDCYEIPYITDVPLP